MKEPETISDEIIIVGSRYGGLADVLTPLYEKGEPIEKENIKQVLGTDVVYLQPVGNNHDPYAVGVFLSTEIRLGYVWMCQSLSLREWMMTNNKKYHTVHISRINTQYGFMIAKTDAPIRLADYARNELGIDNEWAKHIPGTMRSITEQSLSLGFALLCDELLMTKEWSDALERRFVNLNRHLPADLSSQHMQECLELYYKMKQSSISEVRESCDNMLQAYISRGSKSSITWWVNEWLPSFFREAEENDLLGLFEAANYTLERVEELLEQAPSNLFYLYKFNREQFAFRLYYSALPQEVYNRLLTLLAVREAMIEKKRRAGKYSLIFSKAVLARAVEDVSEYFWGFSSNAVLYCVYRDAYKYKGSSADFERLLKDLDYKKEMKYLCSSGTIANAFSHNPYMKYHIDKWEGHGVKNRVIRLRDEFIKSIEKAMQELKNCDEN